MEIVIIGILALALLAGLALFVFKNAAKIVALVLVLVVFIGYIGWHIYLKDKGISPKQGIESVNKKGEKIFNGVMDSMIGSVSSASTKALDTAKEKALEATDKAKETTKNKATEITTKAKKKAKDKVNEVLE